MNIKIILSIVGIIFTVIGWFISHGEDINWVKRLIAPQYTVVIEAYENMIINKSYIKEGDPGFQQIAKILSEKLSGPGDLTISNIHILDHGFSIKSYNTSMKSVPTITIEITVRDGRKTQTSGLEDLRPEIEKRYLKKSIFKAGAWVFWVGILIGIFSIFVEKIYK